VKNNKNLWSGPDYVKNQAERRVEGQKAEDVHI
jgi:hypothetical protein